MPRRALALLIFLTLMLSACGGAAKPEPTTAPLERPTSTPRPTVTPKPEPTAEPEPTVEPTPKTLGGNSGSGDLSPVEIGALTSYTHPGGLFTIQIPENWTSDDKSNDLVAAVTWLDPTRNALVVIAVSEEPTQLSQDELAQRLQTFVDASKDEPDFSAEEPKNLDSGGVQIIWSYTATADGGVKAPLLLNSFIYQDDNKISMLMFGVPDAQFKDLKSSLDEMLNSYSVDTSVALGGAASDDGLPDAKRYDFSDDKGGWIEEDTDSVSASRSNGVYTVAIKAPNQYYMLNPDMDIGSEQGVAATVDPSGDARAGVLVRLSKSGEARDYYACWINANGRYGCFVSIRDEWTVLQDSTKSAELNVGEPNRIKLTITGSTLTFSINGTEVYTVDDENVTEGRAGLYLENFEDPVSAVFDDVAISSK